MARRVHAEGLRERQNMKDAARNRKNGDWCVVGFCDEWEGGFGLQGCNYNTKADAQASADKIDEEEEFSHVDEHKVMKNDEYRELCEGTDTEPPSRMN